MRSGALSLLLWLAWVGAACGEEAASSRAFGTSPDSGALSRAEAACADGDVAAGLATLDSVLTEAQSSDALVARALCRWVDFHATGNAETGEAVEEDLTRALAQARVDGADEATLARIYSHRAALRRALDPAVWPATLADLNAAVEADTSRHLYVLDRAVARLRRGDSAAAARDLDWYLQLDTLVGPQGDLARELRDSVRAGAGRPRRAE